MVLRAIITQYPNHVRLGYYPLRQTQRLFLSPAHHLHPLHQLRNTAFINQQFLDKSSAFNIRIPSLLIFHRLLFPIQHTQRPLCQSKQLVLAGIYCKRRNPLCLFLQSIYHIRAISDTSSDNNLVHLAA